MDHVAHLLGVLATTLAAATLCGWLAQRIGQPASWLSGLQPRGLSGH
jgi:uncharacterized membrane protein AbrB (regulator of aidB expression)